MKKIIFCAGFGYTGSGAVLDMLSEVDHVHVMKNEFRVIADPDGLLSLRRSLTRDWSLYGADRALNRFERIIRKTSHFSIGPYALLNHSKEFGSKYEEISNEFITNLFAGTYKGYWYGNDNIFMRVLNTRWLLGKLGLSALKKQMRIVPSLSSGEFDSKASDYIQKLATAASEKMTFCFDEGFVALHSVELLEMLPGAKLILTIRNPLDVIATTKSLGWNANPVDISLQIEWLFTIYNRWIQLVQDVSIPHILVIKFEDLINDYEKTKKEIFDYLEIDDDNQSRKYTRFDPNISRQNVGIAKDVLSAEDINKIESKFQEINEYFGYR